MSRLRSPSPQFRTKSKRDPKSHLVTYCCTWGEGRLGCVAERTLLTSLNYDEGASRSRRNRRASVAWMNGEVQAVSHSYAWSNDAETSSRTVALSRPWSSAFAGPRYQAKIYRMITIARTFSFSINIPARYYGYRPNGVQEFQSLTWTVFEWPKGQQMHRDPYYILRWEWRCARQMVIEGLVELYYQFTT